MSGHADGVLGTNGLIEDETTQLLRKPFTPAELTKRVADLLGTAAAGARRLISKPVGHAGQGLSPAVELPRSAGVTLPPGGHPFYCHGVNRWPSGGGSR